MNYSVCPQCADSRLRAAWINGADINYEDCTHSIHHVTHSDVVNFCIDTKMLKLINAMNRAGYLTSQSCEGFNDGSEWSEPWITFTDKWWLASGLDYLCMIGYELHDIKLLRSSGEFKIKLLNGIPTI